MNADELRTLQGPLKTTYRDDPEAALNMLTAEGRIGAGITCRIDTGRAVAEVGLHPATGGDGLALCSVTCSWRRWSPVPE